MLRNFIILFFIWVFAIPANAQTNSTVYIASPKGLSLRESPNKDAKRIQLLEYGTSVINKGYTEAWETIDGYSGRWMKVSTEDGKNGYIFDGYTLPFKVPTGGDLKEYFASIFGRIVFEDSIVNRSDGDDYMVKNIYHYDNGVIYIEAGMYESGESSLMNIRLDPHKAYLLYYLIEEKFEGNHHLLPTISYPQKEIRNDTLHVELDKYPWGSLYINKAEEGPTYWVTISYLSGEIVITWGSGV